jgi:hypothetical protein
MCGRHDAIGAGELPRFTDTGTGTGTGTGRLRVLFESGDGGERWAARELLFEAGYDVVTCGGPPTLADGRCPEIAGEVCPAACQADVIVSSLSTRWPLGPEILSAVREEHPETPIIVEAAPGYAARHRDVLDGCEVLYPLTAQSLLAALERVTST